MIEKYLDYRNTKCDFAHNKRRQGIDKGRINIYTVVKVKRLEKQKKEV